MARDDFSQKVKNILAQKAGYVCSYPLCRMATRFYAFGDKSGKKKNIGEASHITAASEGGPRYDGTLTKRQRSSEDNGIWLCRNHAHYIDVLPDMVTREALLKWKNLHEKNVSSGIISLSNAMMPDRLWQIKSIVIDGILPFKKRTVVDIGRFNVLVGPSNVGKSTLVQAACSFASECFYKFARKRFVANNCNDLVEIGIDFGDDDKSVNERYVWQRSGKRFLLKPSSKICHSLLLQGSLNALIVDDDYFYFRKTGARSGIPNIISGMANMLGLSIDQMWAAIGTYGDVVTPFGCRLYRDGKWGLMAESPYFVRQEYNGLSSGEKGIVIVEIALRCLYAAPADQQWFLVVENGVINRLDDFYLNIVMKTLYSLPLNVQIVVCANDGHKMTKICEDIGIKFASNTKINGMSIWSSNEGSELTGPVEMRQ